MLKKIKSDFQFCRQARVFSQVGQGKHDIIVTRERALVSSYGGAKDEGLDRVYLTIQAAMRTYF